MYYTAREEGVVRCDLCPHGCLIRPGQRGICLGRANHSGRLVSENYGRVTALHLDPLEKKPLYHFFPGREILSVGSFGCNLRCGWCQNCDIARRGSEVYGNLPVSHASGLVQSAIASGGIGLAYTYNEPCVWFEFMMEMAAGIRQAGLKNVVVTNGYISREPLEELLQLADAFNTDLKGFSQEFYQHRAGGDLRHVMNTLKTTARFKVHQEITFLVIPGMNDHPDLFQEMVKWIAGELGENTVLHISRYFPAYQFHNPPTPAAIIEKMLWEAKKHLHFVYSGNLQLHAQADTRCPVCNNLVIHRKGYQVEIKGMTPQGACSKCEQVIVINS